MIQTESPAESHSDLRAGPSDLVVNDKIKSHHLAEVRRLKDFLAIFKKIMFVANQSEAI
jgi:hypothetical protein